ncbi:Scarecrow-like transcription factor PAT1 [Hibiscus syriacus]|uniref:Scarecrow-like transcription factor PAT1 n=1 Tax=Hibiscus syriacus TaxID=106335 RepID=A0A6A2ZF28_HIBSY|nr:Scarecrow-like transcription factor PAT1 [Hibiscus syriacus]
MQTSWNRKFTVQDVESYRLPPKLERYCTLDTHRSPDDKCCSPVSDSCVTDNEHDLSHMIRQLETAMLGTDSEIFDVHNLTGSGRSTGVSIESERWKYLMEMIARGDLRELLSRLGAYMLEGLVARLASSGSSIYKALRCKEPASAELLSYMHILYEICPYFKFGYMSANGAIAEAMKDESRIHIIDFQIAQGSQWLTLIHALAARPGGPPCIRITGIDDSTSSYARGGGLERVGQRLCKLASHVRSPLSSKPLLFPCGHSEPSGQTVKVGKEFVSKVCQGITRNGSALNKHCLAREIVNIIACEGPERVERHELLGKWRSRFTMAGFKPSPLSSFVNSAIKTLLQSYCDKYTLEERDGVLYLGWMNRGKMESMGWKIVGGADDFEIEAETRSNQRVDICTSSNMAECKRMKGDGTQSGSVKKDVRSKWNSMSDAEKEPYITQSRNDSKKQRTRKAHENKEVSTRCSIKRVNLLNTLRRRSVDVLGEIGFGSLIGVRDRPIRRELCRSLMAHLTSVNVWLSMVIIHSLWGIDCCSRIGGQPEIPQRVHSNLRVPAYERTGVARIRAWGKEEVVRVMVKLKLDKEEARNEQWRQREEGGWFLGDEGEWDDAVLDSESCTPEEEAEADIPTGIDDIEAAICDYLWNSELESGLSICSPDHMLRFQKSHPRIGYLPYLLVSCGSLESIPEKLQIVEHKKNKQLNGYDCGMYVMSGWIDRFYRATGDFVCWRLGSIASINDLIFLFLPSTVIISDDQIFRGSIHPKWLQNVSVRSEVFLKALLNPTDMEKQRWQTSFKVRKIRPERVIDLDVDNQSVAEDEADDEDDDDDDDDDEAGDEDDDDDDDDDEDDDPNKYIVSATPPSRKLLIFDLNGVLAYIPRLPADVVLRRGLFEFMQFCRQFCCCPLVFKMRHNVDRVLEKLPVFSEHFYSCGNTITYVHIPLTLLPFERQALEKGGNIRSIWKFVEGL